jgi:hypothetical protein
VSRRYSLEELNPKIAVRDGVIVQVTFDCPEADGGCEGRHPIQTDPALACHWAVSGSTAADLTLEPSIRCAGACRWHGFVQAGRITFCADSKSGPEWDER